MAAHSRDPVVMSESKNVRFRQMQAFCAEICDLDCYNHGDLTQILFQILNGQMNFGQKTSMSWKDGFGHR